MTAKKRKRAKRFEISPSVHQAIVAAIRVGAYAHIAAQRAGVEPMKFHEWMLAGKENEKSPYRQFFLDVQRAEAEAEIEAVAIIRRASQAGDWRAAAEWLKLKHPERWSPKIELRVDQRVTTETEPMEKETLEDLGLDAEMVDLFARQMAQVESGTVGAIEYEQKAEDPDS